MDEYLFNCYLNWQRERYGNIFKQLHKIGAVMRIILITTCIIMVSVVIFTVLEYTGIIATNCSLLLMIISIILFVIVKFYTDHYMVKNSYTRLDNYIEYCKLFKDWLIEHGIEDRGLVFAILKREKDTLNMMDDRILKNNERVNKVMQILIIPVALSMLGTILNIQTDIHLIFEIGGHFLILILLMYLLCSFFVSVFNNFIIKQKKDDIIGFVNDLQSIIDLKLYDNSFLET